VDPLPQRLPVVGPYGLPVHAALQRGPQRRRVEAQTGGETGQQDGIADVCDVPEEGLVEGEVVRVEASRAAAGSCLNLQGFVPGMGVAMMMNGVRTRLK
jgi:hypothetical protein